MTTPWQGPDNPGNPDNPANGDTPKFTDILYLEAYPPVMANRGQENNPKAKNDDPGQDPGTDPGL